MQDIVTWKEAACHAEETISEWAEEISTYLFTHPELSDQERESAAYLVKRMTSLGFTAVTGFMGIETAFCCQFGSGNHPRVAFLAEYDALGGFGEDGNTVAHACGHNWIAASTAAAAASAAMLIRDGLLDGTVYLIGTPGEEKSGSKVTMAERGAFDEMDAVFQCHLDKDNCTDTRALAMTDFVFTFTGKASHASSLPEGGINALDACHLTLAGINAMRQQLPPETRIHAVYGCGGASPSIIPAHASLLVYVRDSDKERLEQIIARVIDIGRGAELMTRAKFEYTRAENTYYDLKAWPKLQNYMQRNLEELGLSGFVKGDICHSVSSDIGNVSYACPTSYTTIGVSEFTASGLHEEEFLKFADSAKAHELLHIAAKAMAMSFVDVAAELSIE